jgi:uncharacterized repeat protein (TIGR03803 family)
LAIIGSTLYGVTYRGGANGYGNVFSVGMDGTNYQNRLSFTGTSGAAIGVGPSASLTVGGNTLYGVTVGDNGGVGHYGNIFSIGTDGTNYHNLLFFTGPAGGAAQGYAPYGTLTLSGSTLYGTTEFGGGNSNGNLFSVSTDGTNFHNLLLLNGSTLGSLTLSGTRLYGTTQNGGLHGFGSVFSVGVDGSGYQDLYSFSAHAGGWSPGDLTLSGGTLFGTTSRGGISDNGTVFALAGPFPTPEPGALAIAGCGLVALVSYRWQRMRRSLARARR